MRTLKLLKNKKGFTLVEIIVVLVILAILAVALIPTLTGYIDKANERVAIAECRNAVMAAQTLESESYALGTAYAATDVETLAELPTGSVTLAEDGYDGEVTSLTYDSGDYTVTYTKGADVPYSAAKGE